MKPEETRIVYAGKQIDVALERWDEREYEVVQHPGSVAIVAVDRRRRVVLVRQRREPARRILLELPAGALEPGEEPIATARRELAEETGLRGGEWRELAAVWTSPGVLDERMHVFLADDVEEGEASPEDDEDVELVRWPLEQVEGRLGEIEDMKTLAGLLLLVRLR